MHLRVLNWMLDSDPVIRWQTPRDLMGKPKAIFAYEQARVPNAG